MNEQPCRAGEEGRAARGTGCGYETNGTESLPRRQPQVHKRGEHQPASPTPGRGTSSQARGQGTGVRGETPRTLLHTRPGPRHTCAGQTRHRKRHGAPGRAPGWLRARGKGGQETPHPPGQRPQVSPGPGCLGEGHRGPGEGPGLGTWAHAHQGTPCARHRRPASRTAHHGNGAAPSERHHLLEGSEAARAGEAALTKAQPGPAWPGVREQTRRRMPATLPR